MRFFTRRKDGGPESRVHGYWLVEIKALFSIVLLRFDNGTRDTYHSHAFTAWSWVLRGRLEETLYGWRNAIVYTPSLRPIYTPRTRTHQVRSVGTTWVLSFRSPWASTWIEYEPKTERITTLTHGRKIVGKA